MGIQIQPVPALLVLQDGTVFSGQSIGKAGTTSGEICFNTSMTGYQEIFTDPSYTGQILVNTNPHIGNYGIHPEEVESSRIQIAGLVCRNFNIPFARKQASLSIQDYFTENGLTGISRVDTRALVQHVRDKGAMNAIISSEELNPNVLLAQVKAIPSMEGLELSSTVSTKEPYFMGNPDSSIRVALLDFGVKTNIIRSLVNRGCYVGIFPAKTDIKTLMAFNPTGFQLSNGPGDPAAMPYAVETVKAILETGKPVFGICLGHQILAQAFGIPTYKMFNGHRGGNHPVKNLLTGKCEVTSQNHGFSIVADAVTNHADVEATHINLNDGTIEGIRHKQKQAFSVQYHPEANPGPHDARYLFDEFMGMMQD